MSPGPPTHGEQPFDVEPAAAHPERIYNYLLGGDDNFAADREAAEAVFGVFPGGIDAGRALVRAIARFINRAVHHLGEAGIRQFVNVGTVFPMLESLHELAREAAPGARVLYVVRDTTVLAQAHRLVRSSAEGEAHFMHSDLRDPQPIVRRAGEVLDLTRPVAVMVLGTLAYIPDDRDPHGMVAQLIEPMPPGSHLVVSHMARDLRAAEMDRAAHLYRQRATSSQLGYAPRSRAEVERFFDGLELVGPGVVGVDRWQPDGAEPPPPEHRAVPAYGAVGRKP